MCDTALIRQEPYLRGCQGNFEEAAIPFSKLTRHSQSETRSEIDWQPYEN